MTRLRRFLAAAFRAARWPFRQAVSALTAPPVPLGSLSHPDGGPGPYLPPGPTVPPAPRIAPLGSPRGEFRPSSHVPEQAIGHPSVIRPCPDEVEGTDDPADVTPTRQELNEVVTEAEAILRRALP